MALLFISTIKIHCPVGSCATVWRICGTKSCSVRLSCRLDDCSGGDFQIRYQALCAMPNIFTILPCHLMGFHRCQRCPFQRLNTGFFIDTDNMDILSL
ncbi:hypothetical protein KKJ25_07410 [Xenorhabdus bovienii]|uniref:hypothetical protein n=1 Tax=Xenorhabdus bovienii TaxID=40576 RepID=UPI00237CA1D3|nr:hypothetical protein [Xenorhabdus bovienii]MDE1487803.1 hypothetical protein [Xenorhabdus bovienii]MDE1489592.1 hypothetical protein [Xenorhabdus bovienii]MDE1494789.1 hypothetical protein [Xenorhabdus bovienii]